MTLPDVETLRLCSILASTAFGAAFFVLWLRDPGGGHLLSWAGSSFLYGTIILCFNVIPRSSYAISTILFAGLSLSNVLAISGVRRLEEQTPFRWWMLVPVFGAAFGHGMPRLAIELGWLPATSMLPNIGDAAGLILSMSIVGGALLWGPTPLRTAGHRIAGAAQLGYIPAYLISIAGEYGLFRGMEMLALLAMLSDQALLGILNLGLLAIPIERAQRQLQLAALRDPLTGAWNRAGLEIQKRRFFEPGATAIVIDVDHFKAINDRHGHAAGDEILMMIGREVGRLSQANGGELARLGGDEFAILLSADCASPARFAEQVRADLQAQADGAAWSVSMGMASVKPGERDFTATLHRADSSLYRAKAEGRGAIAAR